MVFTIDPKIAQSNSDTKSISNLVPKIQSKVTVNIKQIFHIFLFNIRNYSPEVINFEYYIIESE